MYDINSEEYAQVIKPLTEKEVKSNAAFYEQAIKHAKEMSVHAYGKTPEEILKNYRPGETEEIKKYRLSTYEPKTKSSFGKVMKVLYKIFSEKLYEISYAEDPGSLKKEESLKVYLEEDFPEQTVSLLSYFKTVLLKKMLADPNGLIVIMPVEFNIKSNELCEPFPYFFHSSSIISYKYDDYCIVQSQKPQPKNTSLYYFLDSNNIIEIKRILQNNEVVIESQLVFPHNIGYLPALQIGGMEEFYGDVKVYSSYISDVLPHWNDAIRLDSDLQASYVQYLYPERVEIEQECDSCSGEGHLLNAHHEKEICRKCNGTGNLNSRTPYGRRIFKVSGGFDGDNSNLFPGVQYVEKDTKIVEILEQKVEREIDKGLEAINMDIVRRLGSNQSGIAKEYDRTELNTFLKLISDSVWHNINECIYFIAMYRYRLLLGQKGAEDYRPTIKAPKGFENVTDGELISEIKMAGEAGASKGYMKQLQIHQARIRFGEDSIAFKRIETSLMVQPHYGKSADDLLALRSMRAVSDIDIYVNSNIERLLYKAEESKENFYELKMFERRELIYALAQEEYNNLQVSILPIAP